VLTFAPHARPPMIAPDDGSGLSDFAVCDIDKAFELAIPSKAKVAGPGGENAKGRVEFLRGIIVPIA
jgi:hypothetical protein